jgi:hypothetical protein
MMKYNDKTIMKAVVICHKPYLKPEEAMIYCNLGRTQLAKKCEEYWVFKNRNGYYKKDELDLILFGGPPLFEEKVKKLKL